MHVWLHSCFWENFTRPHTTMLSDIHSFQKSRVKTSMTSNAKFIFIGLGVCSLASLILCFFYVILRLAVLRVRMGKIDDAEMQDFKKQEAREETSSSSR
jgi:hypothetical protein